MFKPALVALTTAGFLSFCDTAEERADGHFQSGLALLEQGDVDRALVEFRNVFKLDGQHREARLLYANAERERGNVRAAYGQYLRLVEQYPDSLPGQRALAEMSLDINDWEAARRHATAAAELDPEDPIVQAVNATLAYRDALTGIEDVSARAAAVATARKLVAEHPELMIPRRVVIDDLTRKQDWTAALAAIDSALVQAPKDRALYTIRLAALEQLGETAEIRAQLEEMIRLFPDEPNVQTTLVRWHMSQGDVDAAGDFLKARADGDGREVDDIVTYIRFLAEARDTETALSELNRILDTDPPELERLSALRAGLRFDLGERDAAISELESLVDGMEPSDERRKIMVMLARIQNTMGNAVGARALVEEVLQEDPSQPEALKMRAGWLIESDRTDEAIVALRSVLGEAPEDAGAMTLMAQAHERAGNRDLMADMLSRAVDASGNAVDESLRYAGYLIAEGNPRTAETVLINALRLAPDTPVLLNALGEVYIGDQDWSRLTQVIDALRGQQTPITDQMVNNLTARQLAAENREDELLSFLDKLAGEGAQGLGAAATIVRARLAQGDVEGARAYARQTLDDNPGNPDARFLLASLQAVTGEIEAAETALRALADEFPQDQRFWLALYNVYAVQEDEDTAVQALRDGLAANPENLRLNWAMAGILEREGDIAGAIDIYEKLYAANSNNLIIANNLASLLSTGRDDAESLDRAHEIARRLRGRDLPAFQDTYGWIAFRRGDLDTAVTALEKAAEGLPGEASVQYHLARTYAARDEGAKALTRYTTVVEIVGDGPRPGFMPKVEAEIERLQAEAETNAAEDDAQN